MTKKEITLGLTALFWVILTTTIWMWQIEHRGPYYGYYDTHDLTIQDTLLSLVM